MTPSAAVPFAAALALRGWFPPWLAALLGVVAVVAVVAAYLREAGRLPVWRRLVLASLRAVALCSILFLLLKPTLLWESAEDRPRPVALLVDDSQSLGTREPRTELPDRIRLAIALDRLPADKPLPDLPSSGDLPTDLPEEASRLEVLKGVLTNPRLDLLERLRGAGPLQVSTFGAGRYARDGATNAWVTGLSAQEPRTALADAGLDILKRDANELPTAIVVMSDGRDNASKAGLAEFGREAARRGVPLHVYAVGSAAAGRLALRDITVPETLFVEDTVSVPVRYRAAGHRAARGEVVLTLGGREVARQAFDLREGDDLVETLSFVPTAADVAPGKQELTATIRLLQGGAKPADELGRSVRVVDRKLKVLVADSLPRWDFKYLQRALLRDRRVEVRFWLSEAAREVSDGGPPFLAGFPADREALFAFDLLILGDLSASSLSTSQMEAVRDFVAEGGGLVQLAGRRAGPSSYVGTPLAELLPVEFSAHTFPIDPGTRSASFRPRLTPAGLRSPVLRLADTAEASEKVWKELPEVYWHYPVTRLKPAAEALLAHPTARTPDGEPVPLLALHTFGKGTVVFCGTDETWRWRYNAADKFFGRFWSQVVYVAGVSRSLGTKFTQLSLDTPDPLLGQTGQVYARLTKSDLSPQTADEVEATLTRLDTAGGDRTSRVTLRRLPGGAGDYTAALPFNAAGKFTLAVDNGGNPGTLEYRVTLPPDHELSPGGVMEADLRKLAEESGGAFYREEDLHKLPAAIVRATVPVTARAEVVLWNAWSLAWVVGLLSLEWFLRKFSSLS
jgi:hypothetical protein